MQIGDQTVPERGLGALRQPGNRDNTGMRPLVLCVFFAAGLQAATPLFESSFDSSTSAWTAVRGKAVTDPAVVYQGRKSLRVEAGAESGCERAVGADGAHASASATS